MFSFVSTIYKEGMNYVVRVPDSIKTYLNRSGYIPVRGKIDDQAFKGILTPRKNESFVLFVNRDIRTKIKKTEADEIAVSIEFDPESRELSVPEDVELILSENAQLIKEFHRLTPAHRRELILFVEDAKKPETRLKRIQRLVMHIRDRLHA
jgi:uncharacterized protein YdeI (YjbR/CyaY-like superfamily)